MEDTKKKPVKEQIIIVPEADIFYDVVFHAQNKLGRYGIKSRRQDFAT